MEIKNIIPSANISLFVKNIMVFEEADLHKKTSLPFYADGYPGIMFQQTNNGLQVMPHAKEMPSFFLYGQTIRPIELVMDGAYQLIVFQLYPFVLKSFFDITASHVNDGCYDLLHLKDINTSDTINRIIDSNNTEKRVDTITGFLQHIFELKKDLLDFKIRQAIQLIIDSKGVCSVTDLCRQLKITTRSFERRFLAAVGVSPKQLSKIIQFDASLSQLNERDYTKLTDIVYANGFADQSHFIRVFKAFTGTTPKKFTA